MRFGVNLAPLLGETLQRASAIDVPQQRPCRQPPSPIGEQVDRRIQPDRDGSFVEHLAGGRVDENVAARRDHADFAIDEAGDEAALAVAEIGLPEPFEDLGRRVSRGIFDRRIRVDEGEVEAPGETTADSRLAGAHQSDEYDRSIEPLGNSHHHRGYTAASVGGKSACIHSPVRDA